MSNFGFDPLSPWLRFRPSPEDLPGFRVRPVDVASDGVPGLARLATDGDGYGSARAGQRPARRRSRIISLVGAVNRPQHRSSRADPSHTGLGFARRPMRFRASD